MSNKQHTPALGYRELQELGEPYQLDPQMIIGAAVLMFLAGCIIGLIVLVAISYA